MKIDVPRVRALWRDQHGSALLECALVLPVLIALLTGVFEFSWLFYQQHLVSIGLRDASSYLANAPDPCNPNSRVWAIEQALEELDIAPADGRGVAAVTASVQGVPAAAH